MDMQGLFEALDGREVLSQGNRWRVEVFSISDQAEHRWIELAVRGRQEHLLTLRMPPQTGAQHTLSALISWLGDPWETVVHDDVLNVA